MNEILEVSNWDDYLEKLNPSQKDYYYSREYYEFLKRNILIQKSKPLYLLKEIRF